MQKEHNGTYIFSSESQKLRHGRLPGDTPERDTRILQLFSYIVQGTYILGLKDLAKNLYCDYFVILPTANDLNHKCKHLI